MGARNSILSEIGGAVGFETDAGEASQSGKKHAEGRQSKICTAWLSGKKKRQGESGRKVGFLSKKAGLGRESREREGPTS